VTANVVLASGRDLPVIDDIMVRAFDPRFGEGWSTAQVAGALAIPDTWIQLIRAPAITAGFALTRRILDEAELMLIAVLPEARGSGLGKALIAAAMQQSRLRGARRMFLEVRDGNAGALSLYRSTGFSEIGRRKGYYTGKNGSRYDAVTLQLNFPAS
jgi:ribosomal-protein-alanine N-acetyltransferase